MARFEPLHRRAFITQLGKGVLGIAVLGGIAACGDGTADTTTTVTLATTTVPPPTRGDGSTTVPSPETTSGNPTTSDAPQPGAAVERVNLGFVSAYILSRGSEAAVVDTGVAGSVPVIEASLASIGLGWGAVGHVILTHLHGDHIGSIGDVMAAATDAEGYAGAADISGIDAPRPLTAVGTGDRVFGLDIISTPGHTPGHISVFDPHGGALIAGDALNGAGSGMAQAESAGIAGPNPQFTPEMEVATASLAALAALAPNAIFFGHGEPLLDDAAAALAALAG